MTLGPAPNEGTDPFILLLVVRGGNCGYTSRINKPQSLWGLDLTLQPSYRLAFLITTVSRWAFRLWWQDQPQSLLPSINPSTGTFRPGTAKIQVIQNSGGSIVTSNIIHNFQLQDLPTSVAPPGAVQFSGQDIITGTTAGGWLIQTTTYSLTRQ